MKPLINCECIVLWKKKRKYYSLYGMLTKERGIVICSVPHTQAQRMKAGGYLTPFSKIYISLKEQGEIYNLQQLDGEFVGPTEELEDLAYISLAGEMVANLFPAFERDMSLYKVVEGYAQIIQHKSVRLGTILLGWQLLSLSGYIPSVKDFASGRFHMQEELKETLEITLSDEMLDLIEEVLKYGWTIEEQVVLRPSLWSQLETILLQFVASLVDYEMKSINFIRSIR